MEEPKAQTKDDHKIRDYQTTVTILEHLSDAVFILSPEGNILYANRVATDLLGQPFNTLLRQNLNDFLNHPLAFDTQSNHPAKEKSFIKDIYQSGLKEIENEFKTAGYQIPVLLSFGIIRNREDQVQYLIASAKDLSLRKNLEKEQLQKQLLTQSRDRYRELGELAINIVHRLSQPITSIQLLNEMTRKAIESPQTDKKQILQNLRQIGEMLNDMSEVINNVRNFAFSTEEESLKPIRLENVIEEAIQQLHYEITEADLAINIQLPETLPGVMAHGLHLQQVFQTIIRFFLKEHKATQSSTVLTIRLQNIKNHWIEIAIFQGDSLQFGPTKESAQSLSLADDDINLTIIQLILTSFGGDFNFWSQNGHPSTFLLRLPADQQNERDMLLNLIELMN